MARCFSERRKKSIGMKPSKKKVDRNFQMPEERTERYFKERGRWEGKSRSNVGPIGISLAL